MKYTTGSQHHDRVIEMNQSLVWTNRAFWIFLIYKPKAVNFEFRMYGEILHAATLVTIMDSLIPPISKIIIFRKTTVFRVRIFAQSTKEYDIDTYRTLNGDTEWWQGLRAQIGSQSSSDMSPNAHSRAFPTVCPVRVSANSLLWSPWIFGIRPSFVMK